MSDDEAIIAAFIDPARRDRWRKFLLDPRRRRAMLDRLNHCRDLDARYARSLPTGLDVGPALLARGAPATCYVLSDLPEIDGRTLPLDEAIAAAERGGYGTILSCLPGKLAYYRDECGERHLLLERPPHAKPF